MTVWPLALQLLLAVLLAALMIGLSSVLGERHHGRATGEPYEAGMPPTGTARGRLTVRFYVVGLLFVIFDVEAVFFFAWAVALRDAGWAGFAGIGVFAAVLVAALVYEWRQGALDWGPRRARGPRDAGGTR